MTTWWIDKPRLLGSENPTLAELGRLRREGFSVLVSLLEEDEQPPRHDVGRARDLGFTRFSIPVREFQPPAPGQLEQFVSLIGGLPAGARTIVHCEAGIGRTGTFAAAYWVSRGLDADEAIARVREARPGAVETREQEVAVRDFAAGRKGQGSGSEASGAARP